MILNSLPVLDGTRPTTNARLESWLAGGKTGPIDDALHRARMSLQEAAGCVKSLAPAEECANEECTKLGDVEYLSENLDAALESVREAEAAVADLGVSA